MIEFIHDFMHNWYEQFSEMGVWGLGILAFVESSVFLIPPDFLLIAMCLANPSQALLYALICTIFSALGGGFGYSLGKFGGRPVFHFLFKKQEEKLNHVEELYDKYGVWAVLSAAFTPIPYKVFTIASGIFNMNFPGFIFASVVGRGARFFLVAICLMLFGETIKQHLNLVILLVSLVIVIFFVLLYKKRHHLKTKDESLLPEQDS